MKNPKMLTTKDENIDTIINALFYTIKVVTSDDLLNYDSLISIHIKSEAALKSIQELHIELSELRKFKNKLGNV